MIAGTIGQHVTITTHLDPDLRHSLADASQLSQVLINLSVNARDAMPDGGHLRFETANIHTETAGQIADLPAGDYVHIAVIDTGHGMSAEVAQQAIEPFYTTKPRGQGSGLGLATSYGIINQVGGGLVIDSTPGHGTTMNIYLPTNDEPIEGTETVTTPTSAATGQTILLAEDEDGLRDAVTRQLTGAGYHVLAAPNGREALTIAERHDGVIHAVLTDVVMPVMNGRELAEALRQVRPTTPVLFMSGYAGPLMTEQGLLDPDVTVLSKPFTKPELLTALHALVKVP
jgi:CheY-like chemotaxis protein